MITEDYVSVEIVKLLKEKGFDLYEVKEWVAEPQDESTLKRDSFPTLIDFIESEDFVELPITSYHYPRITLQMAMKWLREIHKLFISIQLHMDGSYVWYIYRLDCTPKGYDRNPHNYSYEQACEAAIKYCLENLI